MMGFCELLKEDLPNDGPQQSLLDGIYSSVSRARDLVKQILAFSKHSEYKKIPVLVQKILGNVFEMSRSTIPSNIEITRNIQEDCGMVLADPTQLHQVALNLITNAMHAVENTGGRISIQLRETVLKSDDFAFESLEPGPYLIITVSDTGCGMDPFIRSKIFEPYFTTKPQGKGSGIGLAVVYNIVTECGGDIKVYSEVGKGSTFNVYLPVLENAAKPQPDKEGHSDATGNERILLVDDEAQIVKLEKIMLERLGYRVTARTSSVDALEVFRANPDEFDLVISDMAMPNMTGEQFARELISLQPEIRIIICTGFSEDINRMKAEQIGVRGFLMKPAVKSEIAAMVRQVLDQPEAGDGSIPG
jgi:CheY-like chemotaxis protein